MTSETEKEEKSSGGFTTGLILGTVIGSGLMFLHTTKQGKSLRLRLQKEFQSKKIKANLSKLGQLIDKVNLKTHLIQQELTEEVKPLKTKLSSQLTKKLAPLKRYFRKEGKSLKKS